MIKLARSLKHWSWFEKLALELLNRFRKWLTWSPSILLLKKLSEKCVYAHVYKNG